MKSTNCIFNIRSGTGAMLHACVGMSGNAASPTCPRKRGAWRRIVSAACGIAMLFLFAHFSSIAHAAGNAAAQKVREGIDEFRNRDFKAALKAFEEAESIAPDDLRLAFDRGCAYAASGDFDKAVEQFQKSAAAADRKLAAFSSYNLGCVATRRAKAKFGEKPEEAEGDARVQGMEPITAAVRHFRDVLSIDSQDEDARYNLEMLRTWSKYIQKTWKDRDRQRRREKSNLLEYLETLETEQRRLRMKVQELQSIVQDSPRKRQSLREADIAQRELLEEIEPLKQKIDQLAAGQGSAAGQSRGPGVEASLPADAQKAVELLKSIADEVGKSMQAAADRLAENSLPSPLEPQASAIENIDQIFTAVAPYVNLVQKGITREEELIGLSNGSPLPKGDALQKASPLPKGEGPGVRAKDDADAAWNQRFVARYGKVIPFKAKQELKQLESQLSPAIVKTSPNDSTLEGKEPKTEDAKADAALKAEEQRREMKEALRVGIQLAPKVEQLARESADLLSRRKNRRSTTQTARVP